jgi:hypothetical protein
MATKTAAKPVGSTARETGYKQHMPGRRKGKVHELFDKEGPEAAWTLGRKLRLKENTLRSWFGQWKRSSKRSKSQPVSKRNAINKQSAETVVLPPVIEATAPDVAAV